MATRSHGAKAAFLVAVLAIWSRERHAGAVTRDVPPSDQAADEAALSAVPIKRSISLCTSRASGIARCHARVVVNSDGSPATISGPPAGAYGPSDIRAAYGVPAAGASGRTVAIVSLADDANAESELATYRAQYGIAACTSASGCFTKVNENGAASPLPTRVDTGETALDIEMVSAVCPNCRILLLEVSGTTLTAWGTAYDTAAALGAVAISDSWMTTDESTEILAPGETFAGLESHFVHPGVTMTNAAGDHGYDGSGSPGWPTDVPEVLAVGGTTLVPSTSTRGWAEAAYNDTSTDEGATGSFCSAVYAKPSYQRDTLCTHRMANDLAAVADPATGVAAYSASTGWGQFGGTSAAAPIVASIFAALGLNDRPNSFVYDNPSEFYDVTVGDNWTSTNCGNYECNAEVGYDGPTGIGTPNGAALAAPVQIPAIGGDAPVLLLLLGAIGFASRARNGGVSSRHPTTWEAPDRQHGLRDQPRQQEGS